MGNYHYEQHRPPAPLIDAIECFWRLIAPTMPPPDEMISAEGRAEMLFQFDGVSQAIAPDADVPFECTSSWLVRPYAHALRVRQVGISGSAMIGVRFTPAGWAMFQHSDTTDNQAYSLMTLRDFHSPADVRILEEQLYDVLHTPHWSAPLVTYFLQRKIEQTHYERICYTTQQLRQRNISVSALAQEVNLSERQFGRVFRQLIGLSPKQFSRIVRLDRVLNSSAYSRGGLTLEHLARRYGYHDSAHLVHEFQDLAGMTPAQYFDGDYDLIEQKFREHDRFLQ
ncbi:MAG: helix-turn-helix transcriptional regulator [Chloroflexota bacterium]